eukprot:749798-Hanusia_phi.AAC.7
MRSFPVQQIHRAKARKEKCHICQCEYEATDKSDASDELALFVTHVVHQPSWQREGDGCLLVTRESAGRQEGREGEEVDNVGKEAGRKWKQGRALGKGLENHAIETQESGLRGRMEHLKGMGPVRSAV